MATTREDLPTIQARHLAVSIRAAPGSAPGTLVIRADAHPTTVRMMVYGPEHLDEVESPGPAALQEGLDADSVAWIDVVGLGTEAALTELADLLGMHRLILEDIINVHQRPKCDDYDDRLYLVTRMPIQGRGVESEQISLFLGPRFVATFQERPGDCLDIVRTRIRRPGGRIRQRGPDYLAYAILDAVTDNYFPLLEGLGERLEQMENEAIDSPSLATLSRIRDIKKELMSVRRTLWPMREVFNMMERDTIEVIEEGTRVYLRDCYDHTVQLIDILDNYRELASGLMEIYMSTTGNRMNEIMKVLTIVATIFIPLTFIAGIYGMNFSTEKSPWNMPELAWYLGYPFCLALMTVTAMGMVVYFRRIGFIGGGSSDGR